MGNKASKTKLSIDLNAEDIASQSSKRVSSPSESFSTITARLSSNLSKLTPISGTPIFHSSFPSAQQHINNGVTGTFISYKITKIAATFWQQNIQNLAANQRLEIGCTLYFGALSANKQMKRIMYTQTKENRSCRTIGGTALKYLDMIEWLIQSLSKDSIDLHSLLTKLGTFHQRMGIKINHFGFLLESMHETFSYYFPNKYTIKIKYAMDEIVSLSAQLMTGQDLKCSPHLSAITKTFAKENTVDFIKNLDFCLKSSIGREYFYTYLQQTFCDEIAIFLQLLSRFKRQMRNVQRFMVARDVFVTSIQPSAELSINISYGCRQSIVIAMKELELQFQSKQSLDINADFFDAAEQEIYKLILDNHWAIFVKNIKDLHAKSCKY